MTSCTSRCSIWSFLGSFVTTISRFCDNYFFRKIKQTKKNDKSAFVCRVRAGMSKKVKVASPNVKLGGVIAILSDLSPERKAANKYYALIKRIKGANPQAHMGDAAFAEILSPILKKYTKAKEKADKADKRNKDTLISAGLGQIALDALYGPKMLG